MDILLIILGILCLLTGLVGCFLPILPGPPVSYVGLLFLHFTDRIHFSTTHLILWAMLVIIVQVMDYGRLCWAQNTVEVVNGEIGDV